MSKLKALAEKELGLLKVERETLIKTIEQTEQALATRNQALKDADVNIAELEAFLNPPVEVKQKKGKGK